MQVIRLSCLTLIFALFLAVPSFSQAAQATPAPTPAVLTTAPAAISLPQFYREDWTNTLPASPTLPRLGLPQPLDSLPFSSPDWPYGGAPTLGEPDTQSYPLMSAINGANSRTKLYGWFEPSVNASTSTGSNAPVANDAIPNRIVLNQFVLFAERLPDTVQRTHFDWGFRLTALYGTDYRFTTAKGYLSSQLVDHNRQYGFDPALEYVDLYLPRVAQGLNLRIGRFSSVPGIESQLAPLNYVFSHSLVVATDPATQTGILGALKLSDQWIVMLGLTAGNDVAPWAKDSATGRSDAKPSVTACLDYTTRFVRDNLYLCANGINDGKYAYNNVQHYDTTWYHKFSKRIHTATEAWVMYERDVPALNPGIAPPLVPEPNASGAACAPGLMRCTAPAYATTNFLNAELTPHTSLSLRTGFLNDKKGQRTGHQTRYSAETLSLTHWIGCTVELRPEIRFDHAWDRPAYSSGTRQNQFTAATDLIVHF